MDDHPQVRRDVHGQSSYSLRMDWGPTGAAAIVGDCDVVRAAGWPDVSPEAHVAADAFEALGGDVVGPLSRCASGLELIDIGYPGDVRTAAEVDSSRSVPVLRDNAFTSG